MVDISQTSTSDQDLGYSRIFKAIYRRRAWFISILVATFSVTLILTLTRKNVYSSSMELLVESNYQSNNQGEVTPEERFTDSDIKVDNATQLNLMRSSGLIQRAVTQLQRVYPSITVEEISESLVLNQVIEEHPNTGNKVDTKIIKAVYYGNNPIKTQDILQALLKVYLEYNLEQQEIRLSNGLAFINEQLPAIRKSVIESQDELEKFRTEENLINSEAQAQAIADALNETMRQKREIQTQYQGAIASFTILRKQLDLSPNNALIEARLSQSSRYQNILNQIQETELNLNLQRQQFTDEHPSIIQLNQQHKEQIILLEEEMQRVVGTKFSKFQPRKQALLTQGQLGSTEQDLVAKLTELEERLNALKAQQLSLIATEKQLRKELNRLPRLIAEYDRLQPEVETSRATLEKLLEARQDLGLLISRGGFNWQVVEAPLAGERLPSNKLSNLLLGAVVGIFLGGLAVFIAETVDDVVHTSDELEQKALIPLLGMLPKLSQDKSNLSVTNLAIRKTSQIRISPNNLVTSKPFQESLDLIYKNIQLIYQSSSIGSLLVTSALRQEGKSTIAAGLAISAARLNQRVILIDADLRNPSLHKQFNLANDRGLSYLLETGKMLPDLSKKLVEDLKIDVLTAGPTPQDPVKLLSSNRMKKLIAAFEENYDVVLIDGSPTLGIVDSVQIGSYCKGVLMIGRIGQVTQRDLTEAITMLKKLNLIGIIANSVSQNIK